MGVCVEDSTELNDISAAVAPGKGTVQHNVIHFIGRFYDSVNHSLVIYMLTSQYSFWRDRPHYKNNTSNQSMHSCGCWVSVWFFLSPFLSLSLSLAQVSLIVCLSLSLPCYPSLSILFAVWGHYIYSITDRYQVCVSFSSMLTAV